MTLPAKLSDLNPDAMSLDDLDALAIVLRDLLSYTLTKAKAMRYRAAGQIRDAQKLEALCERLYGDLPAHWRW